MRLNVFSGAHLPTHVMRRPGGDLSMADARRELDKGLIISQLECTAVRVMVR
jgi:hypothetical protein